MCLLGVIWLTLGTGGCSEKLQPDPAVDITEYYHTGDDSAVVAFMAVEHYRSRRQIENLLNEYLKARGHASSVRLDSLSSQLQWLLDHYDDAHAIPDLQSRYQLYDSMTVTEALDHLRLDSLYRHLRSTVRRAETATERNDAIRHLRGLHYDYAAIPDSFAIAAVGGFLGRSLFDLRQFDSALTVLLESRTLCRRLERYDHLGDCDLVLARIASGQHGDYQMAETYLLEALRSFRKIGWSDRVLYVLNQRAYNYQQMCRYRKAAEQFTEAAALARESGNARGEAYSTHSLGEVYYDLGQLDSAMAIALRAQQLRKQLADRMDAAERLSDLAHSVSTIGLILHKQMQHEDALAQFDDAQTLFERAADTTGLCLNRGRRAWLLIDIDRTDEAAALFRENIRQATKFETRLYALFGLAASAWHDGDVEEAARLVMDGIEQIEAVRGRQGLSDLRAGVLADKVDFYDLLATIHIEQYRRDGTMAWLDSALMVLEMRQARTLSELLVGDQLEIAANETTLIDSISVLRSRLLLGSADSARLVSLLNVAEDSLFALRISSGGMPAETPFDADLIRGWRAQLGVDEIVIEYLVSGFGCFALAMTQDTVLAVDIDIPYDSLEMMIIEYVSAINHTPRATSFETKPSAPLGRKIGKLLLPRSLRTMISGRSITIVPSRVLHYLPFGALLDDDDHYLADRYNLSYSPSISSLFMMGARGGTDDAAPRVVAFGDPEIPRIVGIPHLPHAALEIEHIIDVFGIDAVRSFTRDNATRQNLMSLDFGEVSILHLATHGISDVHDASRSAILLSGSDDHPENCFLRADEIARMDLPVMLAFLSSCESGSGEMFPGEGVMNLARPFLLAGCQSIVLTQWNIDDRATAELVGSFYTNLANGDPPAYALASAQRRMIHSDRPLYRHPYYWAAFTVVGR